MAAKCLGHRFVVKIRFHTKRWFPNQRGMKQHEVNGWGGERDYDLISLDSTLSEVERRIEQCMTEDHGVPGEDKDQGIEWSYQVLECKYHGKVRLPMTEIDE